MQRLLLSLPIVLLAFIFSPSFASALSGNEYAMASQPDDSFLCAPDWRDCFDGSSGSATINLGLGGTLSGGSLKSVTIAKDESSPFVSQPWIIEIRCFTDVAYTQVCGDWVEPNAWNGYQGFVVAEFATSTSDSKYWTAEFSDPTHHRNGDGSFPLKFNPNYYYQLQINDNGWNIGAYGSESLGVPYYKITGTKDKADPVVIIPGILGSWQKNGQWIIDPLLHTYDNLIDTFLANGYVDGQTLFRFPYNWEQPNEVTAFELKNKIADIKNVCGCDKVDIVAHSMGGLVAANYIERDDYAYDVDQLFFVATPLSGAPKAYKAWEAGELDFGRPIVNAFIFSIFKLEASKNLYPSIFSYIRNKPITSIQELIPVRSNYLRIVNNILTYPNGYPQNGFLENLLSNFYKISARGVDINTILADTKQGITIGGFSLASSTNPNIWADGQPISTIYVDGDGTVPRSSIENVVPVDKEFTFVDHSDVVQISSSYLFESMTGTTPLTVVNKIYNPVGSFLLFKLFSPIDMQIIAPDGKKLGKDFASNTEVNEIQDAFYSGFMGEDEYAIIPNPLPGQYKVETIGTGNGGPYTIAADYADTATSSIVMITGTSTLNVVVPYTFIISPTSTTISLPPPIATSTPTTTPITPYTCITDITKAYKDKWIGKKLVYEKLIIDCKLLKEELKARSVAKTKVAINLINAAIKLTLANMDLLAKDKGNTKDAVSLITEITTWFRTHELQ